MTFDYTTPADTVDANQIPTYIQNAKTMVGERLQVSNGTFSEHYDITDQSNVGKHQPSEVSFTAVDWNTSDYDYVEPGCLVYTEYSDRLNLRLNEFLWEPLTGMDHGLLEGLDDDDHPQYLIRDRSRPMTGNLTIGTNGGFDLPTNMSQTEDSMPLREFHAVQTYVDAHGANSILERHLTGTLGNADLSTDGPTDNNSDYKYATYQFSAEDVGETILVHVDFSMDSTYDIQFSFTPSYSLIDGLAKRTGGSEGEYEYSDPIDSPDFVWSNPGDETGAGWFITNTGPRVKTSLRLWETIDYGSGGLKMVIAAQYSERVTALVN